MNGFMQVQRMVRVSLLVLCWGVVCAASRAPAAAPKPPRGTETNTAALSTTVPAPAPRVPGPKPVVFILPFAVDAGVTNTTEASQDARLAESYLKEHDAILDRFTITSRPNDPSVRYLLKGEVLRYHFAISDKGLKAGWSLGGGSFQKADAFDNLDVKSKTQEAILDCQFGLTIEDTSGHLIVSKVGTYRRKMRSAELKVEFAGASVSGGGIAVDPASWGPAFYKSHVIKMAMGDSLTNMLSQIDARLMEDFLRHPPPAPALPLPVQTVEVQRPEPGPRGLGLVGYGGIAAAALLLLAGTSFLAFHLAKKRIQHEVSARRPDEATEARPDGAQAGSRGQTAPSRQALEQSKDN